MPKHTKSERAKKKSKKSSRKNGFGNPDFAKLKGVTKKRKKRNKA